MRQLYTYSSDDAIEAGIAALPHKYPMELNQTDMAVLMRALQESDSDDANQLLADILTTLDIETV